MNWVLDKFKGLFATKYMASLGRTMLAALCGTLLGMGIDPATVESFKQAADPVVLGVIGYTVAQGLSWFNAKKNVK